MNVNDKAGSFLQKKNTWAPFLQQTHGLRKHMDSKIKHRLSQSEYEIIAHQSSRKIAEDQSEYEIIAHQSSRKIAEDQSEYEIIAH